jgi:hypothetical protein
MPYNFVRIRVPGAALSILFLTSMCTCLFAQQQNAGEPASWARHAHRSFLVLDSPSTKSEGPDSLLAFDSLGNSSTFFAATHDLDGLRDIACSLNGRPHIVGARSVFDEGISELLEFNEAGRIIRTSPFGTPGSNIALAFDDAGNFYIAQDLNIFKNGALLTSHLSAASEVGKLVADRKGNLYVTLPITSQLLRVDPLGNVTVFADTTKGLNGPFGLTVGPDNEVYVANNPPSEPAFILKFDPSGTPSSFATNISSQPDILGLAFAVERDGPGNEKENRDGKVYATLAAENEILSFDSMGNSSLFADASDGLNFPAAITKCPLRH